jgi:hypothetical protein
MALSGMFGARPLFRQPDPFVTPPYAPTQAMQQPAPGLGMVGPGDAPIAPATPTPPSFFGQGGVGRNIAGGIGDFFLQRAGAAPVFAPAMQQQHMLARQQALHQQELADSRTTWLQQQEYKRTHPDPVVPTEFERAVQSAGYAPGTPEYIHAMQSYVDNKTTAPPIVQHNADGTLSVYPAGMVPRTGVPASPAKPVGKLTPIGGAPSRGGGTF